LLEVQVGLPELVVQTVLLPVAPVEQLLLKLKRLFGIW
jgi:hypothetical protein